MIGNDRVVDQQWSISLPDLFRLRVLTTSTAENCGSTCRWPNLSSRNTFEDPQASGAISMAAGVVQSSPRIMISVSKTPQCKPRPCQTGRVYPEHIRPANKEALYLSHAMPCGTVCDESLPLLQSCVTNTVARSPGCNSPDSRLCWQRFASDGSLVIVTWLILPVVICLSQRLSHACLSINNFVL